MARRRGRPSKPGKRQPDGRLVPPADPALVKPSAWVAAQLARYGQDYCTALGRAYAGGILGQGDDAKARYAGGKRFAALSTKFFGAQHYRCALDQSPRGHDASMIEVPDWQRAQRAWLTTACDALDTSGLRPIIDGLLSPHNTDAGPAWLDRLLARNPEQRDHAIAYAARQALDILAAPQEHVRNRVALALDFHAGL